MRQRFKKVAEAVYFGPKPEPVAPLPATIPVSMQGNELAKKYVQNCKLMDQYADYTEKLETKYTDLYMAHAEMKKQFGMMRDYFKHPSFLQFKRCTNMLETLMPAERVTKPEGIMNNRPEEVRRFKTFKTAIKGQYYYIAYLKAMLHNNKIDYKKKNDFNSMEYAEMDALIEQIVSEKD